MMLLAATTAFANNDSLLNAPAKIKLFPEAGTPVDEPVSPLLAQLEADGKSWWVEVTAAFQVDWLSQEEYIDGGASYSDMFKTGIGIELQVGLNHIWGPETDWFQYSLMLRPYFGVSAHLFQGGSGQGVSVSDLTVTTIHGGLMFGAGNSPDGSGPGLFVYVNLQAGMAMMSQVEVVAPAVFAGSRDLTDTSSDIYYSLSLGVRMLLGGLTFNVEGGIRNLGRPENASTVNPVLSSEEPMVTWYLQFGVTLEF